MSLLELTSAYAAVASGRYPVTARGLPEASQPDGLSALFERGGELQRRRDWAPMLDLLYAAANDGTGGGAIAALKAAGVDPLPPVTGNDAVIAALQRIISGDQYNTISKPSETVAAAAAEAAVKLLRGEAPVPKTTLFDTPSELFVPAVVTRENIKAEIFDAGIHTPEQVCTGEYVAGCKALGILE